MSSHMQPALLDAGHREACAADDLLGLNELCPFCDADPVELRPAIKLLALHRGSQVVDVRWLKQRWYRLGTSHIRDAVAHMFESSVLEARICEIHLFNSSTGRSFCPVDVRIRQGRRYPFKMSVFEPGASALKKIRYKTVHGAAKRAIEEMKKIAPSRVAYRTGTPCSQHSSHYASLYWDGEDPQMNKAPENFNTPEYIEGFYQ